MIKHNLSAIFVFGSIALSPFGIATASGTEPVAIELVKPQASNPDGEHGFAFHSGKAELSLVGGRNRNSSWVMVRGEQLLHPVANLTQGEAVKLTLEDISFEAHDVPAVSQALHITLSPQPGTLPYNAESAFSLELRADGSYSLGVRRHKAGWPSRVNARLLSEGRIKVQRRFPKLELVLASSGARLIAYDDGGNQVGNVELGPVPEVASWNEYGVNLVLQKNKEGEQTQVITNIERISAAKENAP
jgi:hypothetical protein